MQEPVITVGILSGKEIGFSFPKEFISSDGIAICGIQQAVYRKGKICWQEKEYDELSFTPQQDTSSFFELQDVTIGINFHWERKEVQRFKGELKIIVEDDRLTAINIIPIEDYLTSVISSEMSATASLELLKAHAVISRSWLLNKLKVANGKLKVIMHPDNTANFELSTLPSQLIKWYDHEAHKNFDVCADDHCQRYQGITRTSTPQAIEAQTSSEWSQVNGCPSDIQAFAISTVVMAGAFPHPISLINPLDLRIALASAKAFFNNSSSNS